MLAWAKITLIDCRWLTKMGNVYASNIAADTRFGKYAYHVGIPIIFSRTVYIFAVSCSQVQHYSSQHSRSVMT
jgi:hypothetical protein